MVGVWDGFRESEQSWLVLLLDLKRRGLAEAPKVVVGDGAMGFWKALMQVYPSTRPTLLGPQDQEHPEQATQELAGARLCSLDFVPIAYRGSSAFMVRSAAIPSGGCGRPPSYRRC